MATQTGKQSLWQQYKTPILLLGGIAIGSLIGVISPGLGQTLKPIGDIFLNLLFTIVVPLVFVSIACAVGSMANMNRLGKILGGTVAVFLGTGAVAAACVLVWVNLFSPSAGTNIQLAAAEVGEAQTAAQMIVGSLTVSDFPELWRQVPHAAPHHLRHHHGVLRGLLRRGEQPRWEAAGELERHHHEVRGGHYDHRPLGLGAYFANLIGEFGPQLLSDYGRSMVVYYPLCLLYVVIFFPLYALFAGGKPALNRMLKYIFTPAVTAFATQSSAATLPVNKEACDAIGVPKDVSDLVLPMGCTMHMDGSVLSSIVKIAFLFGIFDMPFTGVGTYAMAIAVAILSAFVLSGAPGG